MPGVPTIRAALAAAQHTLGHREARVLLREVVQRDDAYLRAHDDAELSAVHAQQYAAWVARRIHGEPVAYITGHREFYGRDFAVTPVVLIPRHETELLVELALQRWPAGAPQRVLDLGTGSGCIGVTMAVERPQSRVTLVDASAAALEITRANALRWAPANTTVLRSDWYTAVAGERFELILANPPYVAEGDAHLQQGDLRFEPRTALAAGADGLDDIRRIVAGASAQLAPGGWLLFEHGHDQAAACAQLLAQAAFQNIFNAPDLAGILRVSGGRWPHTFSGRS